MRAAIFLSALAASLAYASPIARRESEDGLCHRVTVAIITSPPGQPEVIETLPVELNVLTKVPDVGLYKLRLQSFSYTYVDITQVECRAYRDASGQLPGSAPFNYKQEANVATNPVEEGSILCYIATVDEASHF